MNKRKTNLLQVISIAIIVFSSAILLTWQITYSHTTRKMEEKYTEILSKLTETNDIGSTMYNVDTIVRNSYIGATDEAKMLDYTVSGYIHGLGDKYATYMNAEEYAEYLVEIGAKSWGSVGISTVYDDEKGGLYILNVYENSPAYDAGILPGEIVTRVGFTPVSEVSFTLAVDTINKGNIGDALVLAVKSDDDIERIVELTYEYVDKKTVSGRIVENGIGLVKISEFDEGTSAEFKNTIQYLIVRGAERFVIDIRNNAGGNIDAVSDILDFLLPSGNSVIISHKNGTQTIKASDQNAFSAPIALLINKNTACEAEVFAIALQEYGKAELVGETTYGKSMIQDVVKLPGGGAASISVSTYISPLGVSFEGVGVVPDNEVVFTEKTNLYYITDSEDIQLTEALSVIKELEISTYQ